ncbi:ParB/RepB/Spo0J family partition protein [uncultured Reyranella sp.]|jgi:ParB/RepB/Spo0J family partition protein|uniref:ParB/RepB/Spo0J family partition protein n=1 Tax=uncultured Reyranella sp. TaxID=735512 RepID=UPI00259C8204|nr:ParB/RepB/Spo0J family partition protein [uncultured Reyranella sp.]
MTGTAAATASAHPPTDPQIALPPAELGPVTLKQQRYIPLDLIHPSPFNPRKEFDQAGIAELAESIRVNGLQQNLVVRPHPTKKEHWELMGGERRWRALNLLKAEGAVCKIEEATDAESIALQLIENLQRQDVPPMEEAKAFVELQKADPAKWTPARIAASIGMTKRFVLQRMALATSLIPAVRKMLEAGDITVEKARTLAGAPKHVQEELAGSHEIDEWSVEDLRRHILEQLVPADRAAFDLATYKGGWHEEGDKRYFTDVEQFMKLQTKAAEQLRDSLRKDWPKAEIIDSNARHDFKWADTGEGLGWSSRKGTKAHGTLQVPREKCTAVVWIDQTAKLCHAEGVARSSVFPQARSSYSSSSGGNSGMPPRESAGQRRSRFDFNERLVLACADKADVGLRVALVALVASYGARLTYDSGHTKRAEKAVLPEELLKIAESYGDGDARKVRAWAIVKAMKIEDVSRCLAGYAATAFLWDSNDGKKPKGFTTTIAELLKVAPREVDPPGKAKPADTTAAQQEVYKGVAQIKRDTAKKKPAPKKATAKAKAKAKAKGKKKQ